MDSQTNYSYELVLFNDSKNILSEKYSSTIFQMDESYELVVFSEYKHTAWLV